MKLIQRLFLFVIFFTYSLYADVGFSLEDFKNKKLNRVLKTAIFYPTNEKSDEIVAQNGVFKGIKVKKDAKIKDGKYSLVIFMHGSSGNYRNQSWLASKLVSQGYIVIAANHPQYTTGNATPSSILKVWNQPKDASFLIDTILKSKYKNSINPNNIFVLGHSLGGYSSMALSGAKLDMRGFKSFCTKHNDESCEYFKESFSILNEDFFKKSSKNLEDKRVKASIAIAPGLVPFMTNKSLETITTPVLIIGAQYDKNVPVKTQILLKEKYFSKTIDYKEILDAAHFSFLQVCKPKGMMILEEEEHAGFICDDGKKKTRKQIHNEVYKMVLEFFNKHKS